MNVKYRWAIPLLVATALAIVLFFATTVIPDNTVAHAQGGPALTVDIDLLRDPTAVIKPGDIITQRIRLGYTGGSVNIDAVFVQEIPSGVRPVAIPVLTEMQPQSVTPLQTQRRGRTWGWQGKMQPEALLTAVMTLRVQQCYGDDQTITLPVSARRTPNGANVTDSVTITVDCHDLTIGDIVVTDKIIYANGLESESSNALTSADIAGGILGGRFYLPGTRPTLRITLQNIGSTATMVGVEGNAKCCRCPDLYRCRQCLCRGSGGG